MRQVRGAPVHPEPFPEGGDGGDEQVGVGEGEGDQGALDGEAVDGEVGGRGGGDGDVEGAGPAEALDVYPGVFV